MNFPDLDIIPAMIIDPPAPWPGPWPAPTTPRNVCTQTRMGLLYFYPSENGPVVFGRSPKGQRCSFGHQMSPVPGDLRCDCGLYLYSDLP